MDPILQRNLDTLKTNDHGIRSNAEVALLNICCKVLTYPNKTEYRKVSLSDAVVLEKLLPASGAIQCLLDVGFEEGTDCFFLPQDASLERIQALMNALQKSVNGAKPKTKSFFMRILVQNRLVMHYEDPALQEKARSVIPLTDLEIATMTRIRKIQKYVKLNCENAESYRKAYKDNDINPRDVFLIELMHWFKYKFFSWVDSPICPDCKCECKYESTKPSTNPKCSRVEYHRCNQCNRLVQFPRYNDPEQLLKLRRGRCGEWANVFTLLCRSLGYDARLIWDETDHAWTEVWSETEMRWIHLDSCEDVMDRPLMYEKGWKKKLTYIMAYSKDEVQDVTWRYTHNYTAVMSRRRLCSENSLLRLLELLNARRQTVGNYSLARRREITRRRAIELASFLCIPNQQNQEDNGSYEGRTSGSRAWKAARGEITEGSFSGNYTWDLSKYGKTFNLFYCIVTDRYTVIKEDGYEWEEKIGWQRGVHTIEGGVHRNVENDWKVVYLARSSGNNSGMIKWVFEAKDPKFRILSFKLRAKDKTFYSGVTSWKIEGYFEDIEGSKSLNINNCREYYTEKLKGSQRLILTATVSGGSGIAAWQHAQLFRQGLNNESYSMTIVIKLIRSKSIK